MALAIRSVIFVKNLRTGLTEEVTELLLFFGGSQALFVLRLSRKESAGLLLARLLPGSQCAC
jgi:hypothetical protein